MTAKTLLETWAELAADNAALAAHCATNDRAWSLDRDIGSTDITPGIPSWAALATDADQARTDAYREMVRARSLLGRIQ
jgi:hypothetical protein